jgi:PAS domain S-box-containing protein
MNSLEYEVNPKVLNDLLLLQNVLWTIPVNENMFKTLVYGFKAIPGVNNASYCREGTTYGSIERNSNLINPAHQVSWNDQSDFVCPQKGENKEIISLKTMNVLYGCIILIISDYNLYLPYKPHVENICVFASIVIENKTQKLLIENQKFYRSLFIDNHAIMLLTRKKDNIIVDANNAACKFYEYSKNELIGKNFDDLTLDYFYDPENKQQILTQKNAKGIKYQVEIDKGFLNFNDEDYSVFIVSDITEKLKLEEEKITLEQNLRRSQRLESMGTLAGGICHDFNNILSAMLGFAELSLLELPDHGFDEIKDNINEITYAGNKAKNLIRQILIFSKNQDRDLKIIKFQSIIKDSIKLLKAFIPKSLLISLDLYEGPETLNADPIQIQQIIINVCTNSYQAMPNKKGTIEIILEKVIPDENLLRTQPNLTFGQYFKLTFKDSGCGMSKDTMERMFDPFFTTRSEGTGLGLSTVYGIVASYEGDIAVESEIGKGTSFMIYLPVNSGVSEIIQDFREKLKLHTGSGRIFILDDEQMIVNFMKKMLEKLGYKVQTETDPRKAIEILTEGSIEYDLLILDHNMPYLTGTEVAIQFKKKHPEIPALLMTGSSEFIANNDYDRNLYIDCLIKPINPLNLIKTVEKAMNIKKLVEQQPKVPDFFTSS